MTSNPSDPFDELKQWKQSIDAELLLDNIDEIEDDALAEQLRQYIVDMDVRVKRLEAGLPPVPDPPDDPTPPPDDDDGPTPPVDGDAVWASDDEIRDMPDTGVHWDRLLELADRDTKPINLADNNGQGGTDAQARIMVGIRKRDQRYIDRGIALLDTLYNTPWERTLPAGREIQAVAVAIDMLVNSGMTSWDPSNAITFLMEAITKDLPGHSGFRSVLASCVNQINNWSNHATASVVSTSMIGLKWGSTAQQKIAQAWLDAAVRRQRFYIGEPIDLGYEINWAPNGWQAGRLAGVNLPETTITLLDSAGKPVTVYVSGVIHQDQLRNVIYPKTWPTGTTGYNGEGRQGFYNTMVMLHRNDLLDFNAGQRAVVRSMDWLYGRGENAKNKPPHVEKLGGDDAYLVYLVNFFTRHLGIEPYPVTFDKDPGKGQGFGYQLYGHRLVA